MSTRLPQKWGAVPLLLLELIALSVLGAECAEQATPNSQPATLEPTVPTDLHGDPLPSGAQVRLGTLRWRGPTIAAAFTEDSKSLVSSSGQRVFRWEVDTGRRLQEAKLDAGPGCSAISLAANLSASVDGNQVILCDLSTGKRLRAWSSTAPAVIHHLALSANGKLLAGGTEGYMSQQTRTRTDASVHVWDTTTGQEIARLDGHKEGVTTAFSPNGRQLVTGDSSGMLRVWGLPKGNLLSGFKAYTSGMILKVAFTADGKHVVATDALTVNMFMSTDGKMVREFPAVAFVMSPDSKLLVLGLKHGMLRLVQTDTGREIRSLQGVGHAGVPLAISPDGKLLVSASASNADAIRLWDLETGKERVPFPGHVSRPFRAVFSADGKLVATSTNTGDGTVRIWNAATGRQVHQLEAHIGGAVKRGWSADVVSLAFSPDGKRLASAGRADGVRLWDVSSGNELRYLEPVGDPATKWIGSVAFSPDGQRVAAAGQTEAVHVWKVSTGRLLQRFLPEDHDPREFTTDIQFSPDGSILATGGSRHVILWDPSSEKELRRLEFGIDTRNVLVWELKFSPDAQLLASSGQTGQLHVWQVTTGKPLLVSPPRPQRLSYTSVDFAPDGRWIAHCSTPNWSQPGTTRLIKATTGEVLHQLPNTTPPIAFSPDGKRLLTGTGSTDLLIWDLALSGFSQQ